MASVPWAGRVRPILKIWMKDHGIQRKLLCEKADISNRTFGRITNGFGTSLEGWLIQLKHLFHTINQLTEKPPPGVRPGPKRTWEKLFGKEFPPEPLQEEKQESSTGLDRGAADLGVGWERRETIWRSALNGQSQQSLG